MHGTSPYVGFAFGMNMFRNFVAVVAIAAAKEEPADEDAGRKEESNDYYISCFHFINYLRECLTSFSKCLPRLCCRRK
ncbi:hypothetical protein Barb4_04392 [Bacteroidales bacterium Barb4]|nr:hypothetical protein Barb4_04392 [Bacteroidales bacterium Barb4]